MNLSEEQLRKITQEGLTNLTNEQLTEFYWQVNKHCYKERPVDIDEFITSKKFLGDVWPNIFPIWREALRKIFPTPFTSPYTEVIVSAATGSGKCLGKDTPILMYDGTIKMVQDIKSGDQIMGPDSKPRNILSTCTGREKMYKVIPYSGGNEFTCNESHILSLKHTSLPGGCKDNKIVNISIKDYLQQSKTFKHKYKLYRTPIEFPFQNDLPVDPYIYGLWLGDGSTYSPRICTVDDEIFRAIYTYAEQNNYAVDEFIDKRYYPRYVNVKKKIFDRRPTKFGDLCKQSISTGHKRILHIYKTASRQDRLELLAGIIDTDGYKLKGKNSHGYSITTKYKDLAEDYAFIAGSLGFRTRVVKRISSKSCLGSKSYISYNVRIFGDTTQIPIKVPRKKPNNNQLNMNCLHSSFKLEDLGEGDYYGFEIDGDKLFVLGDFTVTHNTTLSTIGILYDMYKLGCLKDPATYYGLTPGTRCVFGVFSANLALAGSVNWADLTKGISGCPWFKDKIIDTKGLEKKNGSLTFVEILPGIGIQTGSRFQHTMGKAIFGALMDEAAFGQDKSKQSQTTYTELSSRMATRFISYSSTGELPGHMWLVSSPKDASDFLQFRITTARDNNIATTMVMDNIASWEANPKNDSDDKFMVFIGNEFKEAKILEDNEEPEIEDLDYILYVPVRFKNFFKKDLLSSIMNYGGVLSISSMGIFRSQRLITDAMVLQNPFTKNIIQLPFDLEDTQLMDFMDMDYFMDIRHPEANRFIHLDAAYSSKTLDRFGVASTYAILNDKTIYKDLINANAEQQISIFEKAEKMYYVDWAIGITPCDNQEIPFKKVENFILYLIQKLHYPVGSISADTFQSKRTLQEFEANKINTCNISVDRKRDPYLFFKDCVYNRQMVMPKFEELRKEMLQLKDDGRKIDHPTGGCFSGDTIVVTKEGNVPMELLASFGKDYRFEVLSCTPNGRIVWMPARNAHMTKISDTIFEGTLNSGDKFECTPDHRIMLIDGSFKEAQNIQIGEILKGGRHLVGRKILEKQIPVYDITVPFTENFALKCGMFVHNSKDISDAVAGSLWNAYNSKQIMNIQKLISSVMNPMQIGNTSYNKPLTAEQKNAMELAEFERIRNNISNSGIFRGL